MMLLSALFVVEYAGWITAVAFVLFAVVCAGTLYHDITTRPSVSFWRMIPPPEETTLPGWLTDPDGSVPREAFDSEGKIVTKVR